MLGKIDDAINSVGTKYATTSSKTIENLANFINKAGDRYEAVGVAQAIASK